MCEVMLMYIFASSINSGCVLIENKLVYWLTSNIIT